MKNDAKKMKKRKKNKKMKKQKKKPKEKPEKLMRINEEVTLWMKPKKQLKKKEK